ncbi:alpha/beta-hydrolase [Cyathus striatus]|nr:alpha/beta-hydrolase [Cyathus striatus]
MNSSTQKTITTQRGYTYAYYYTPSYKGKPTILLLHGFPCTSSTWSPQFNFLKEHGYGVVVPDMLGYGGTDKPSDAEAYKGKDLAQDVIDVLDEERLQNVVVVSHDWGVLVGTRLVNYHPERVLASVFISQGCFPPDPQYSWEKAIGALHEAVGYDVFGYWEFFASEGAAALIEEKLDTFFSMFFAGNPDEVISQMATRGKFRHWLENNNRADKPAYWTEEDKRKHQAALMKGGFQAPLNWYVARVKALDNKDDETVPKENFRFKTPTLFIAALKDVIGIPAVNEAVLRKYCDDLTVKEIDAGHWVMLEKPVELNEALGEFFAKL